MKRCLSYFDRQTVSPKLHANLCAIRARETPSKIRPGRRWASLAACLALVVLIAAVRNAALNPLPAAPSPAGAESSAPGNSSGEGNSNRFLVDGPEHDGTASLSCIPYVAYPNADGQPEIDGAPSRSMLAGSFSRELTKGDIQTIFWGPEGQPADADGDLPWMLFWEGYTLSGSALYSGTGNLLWITLTGEHPDQGMSFTLTLAPEELPFQCGLFSGGQVTDVNGVPVTGWSRTGDFDGDGTQDTQCVSEFMAGDVGVRFEATCTAGEDPLEGAVFCSSLLVRQALSQDGGLYLGELLTNENIPAWREAEFSSLEEARQEAEFAPYLPEENIPGYGEFYAGLSYQEGVRNRLSLFWHRGYDSINIAVSLPEGVLSYALADPDCPEAYDLRLYPIPWSDSVPEEYWETVNMPVFRAEDMNLAIVEARGHEHDTGGLTFSFGVLYASGALVEYRCDGLTAEQVWELACEPLGRSG